MRASLLILTVVCDTYFTIEFERTGSALDLFVAGIFFSILAEAADRHLCRCREASPLAK